MVDESEFEKFVECLLNPMVVQRSFARGRGRDMASFNASRSVGALGAGQWNNGQNGDSQIEPRIGDGPPMNRLQSVTRVEGARAEHPGDYIREEATNGGQLPSEISGNTDGLPTVVVPNGQSSVNEAAAAPLVNALRAISSQGNTDSLIQLLAGLLTNHPPAAVPTTSAGTPSYQIVPDLSSAIENFTGEDDGVHAREWNENLDSLQELHNWTDEYVLSAARIHLRGGARDWARTHGRDLTTWEIFCARFADTFMIPHDKPTRWAQMLARRQGRNESVSAYFHAKTRLLKGLNLNFWEEKSQIVSGLNSRELFNLVMPGTHYDHDSLLHALIYFDRCVTEQTSVPHRRKEDATIRDTGNNIRNRARARQRVGTRPRKAIPTVSVRHHTGESGSSIALVATATRRGICREIALNHGASRRASNAISQVM